MISLAKTFVIEGADRCGKQTQTHLLVDKIRKENNKVALVEVPFNDRMTYLLIYWMLQNGLAKSLPNLFQFVQFLNKFLFQIFVLPFLLLKNDYVIFDRWALSAIVYGNCGGANTNFVGFLDAFLFKPHGMVVLCGKSHIQGTDDVYELDNEFQATVKEFYKMIVSDLHACDRVNANQTRERVHNEILKYFDFYCKGV